MNWNQETRTAEKGDDTDSTATMATTAFTPTKIKAEKEDAADSSATTTSVVATSVFELEWEDYEVTEGLVETTTPNEQIYVFGERRCVKTARKWRTPSLQGRKEKNSLSPTQQAVHTQTRTVRGVFMFGSAAQTVTEKAVSLSALQELSNHQEPAVQQAKSGKKRRHKDLTTGVQLP